MTFEEALKLQQRFGDETVKVSRQHGPAFWINSLGKIEVADLSCAYTGDFLDFDDWQVEVVSNPRTWRGFRAGDRIVTLVETKGEMPDGGEATYPPGTEGWVVAIDYFGKAQGWGAEISIGWGDATIVNVFDDGDVAAEGVAGETGCPWFRHA